MAVNDTLNEMFGIVGSILGTVTDGLYGIAPKLIVIAILVALIGVVFCSSMQRGAKIAAVIVIALVAFAFGFLPDIVNGLLGAAGDAHVASASSNALADALG